MTLRSDLRLRAALSLLVLAIPLAMSAPAVAKDAKSIDTSRLVSVGGDVTEIIYALGEEKRLVGRDSTSIYPQAATKVPDVGYMRQLSPEGIMATNPTAILTVEGSGPPETLAILKNAAIPMETVPERYDGAGIVEKIVRVGAVLGVEDKAKTLAAKVKADLDAAVAAADARPETGRKRVLFILSMQGGKIMAAGNGTAADAIVQLSGAINATKSFQGYKPVTDEAIIEAKPDVVLMMTRGGSHGASDEELFKQPALALTPAAAKKSVIRMDGLHLLGFGPRTASAVRELNAAIYGKANASQ
ncbi:iron complex transport system substrate-binding protein [Rhizobium sp. PP-F2F-G48]|uniref:heme/hemin ABC transporter substrate-binding protein n=1 Tax=Rhizobium sp. PP-F2F-G48 TaxID=2135651 RepID=UPI001042CF7E|nr:ABC transporter substrate-binding protein [Rhizobium sp. PP-F2F-G48]TCM58347.1 iron complex transport system substrate-binding protein [Rhizobium sp. PP-F2F-G48]